MKLSLILVAVATVSLHSCGQDIPATKVPSLVQNTVQAKFGGAGHIEWEKKKELYEAEFRLDTTEYSVFIDASGNIVMSKTDLKPGDLPDSVITVIHRDYPGYAIDDAARLEKGGVVYYQAELEASGKKDTWVVLMADGNRAKGIKYID